MKRDAGNIGRGLIVAGTMALLGCASSQIIQFRALEQSTSVELRDAEEGESASPRAVLDERQRIETLVSIVNAGRDQWRRAPDEPRATRYTIVFRRDGHPTETFQFDENYLATAVAEGDVRCRALSAAETRRILDTFEFTTNFRTR
jgi:hypothetical protein